MHDLQSVMLSCRLLLAWMTSLVVTVSPVISATHPCLEKYPQLASIYEYQDSCFAFVHGGRRLEYDDAEKYCERFKGTLALIKTPELNAAIAGVLRNISHSKTLFWIGLNDKEEENRYMWVDNTDMQYNNFESAHPYTRTDARDCVAMNSSGKWSVLKCKSRIVNSDRYNLRAFDAKLKFICQYPLTVHEAHTTKARTSTAIPPTTKRNIVTTLKPTPITTTARATTQKPTQAPTTTTKKATTEATRRTTQTDTTTATSPTSTTITQATGNPQTINRPQTTCPVFTCNVDCGLDSYKVDPDTSCLLCQCDD